MKLDTIISILEKKFPRSYAEEWDNVGLLIGRKNLEVNKIQLSLDVSEEVIDKAIENNVNLIVSHHPIIFKDIKRINSDSVLGRKILKLIENKIAVYSMHTNLDSAVDGLNELVGEKLGLMFGEIIDKEIRNGVEYGIGRIYSLEKKIEIDYFIEHLKSSLNLTKIIVAGKRKKIIEKIAIVNGSGSEYWKKARVLGADILVTGDLKYHDALDAKENGMIIVDIGHYESESFFYELIIKEMKKIQNIEILIFNDKPVFDII